MQHSVWRLLFPVFIVLAAGFVAYSSQAMPELVAAHFGGSGQPDGFAPRQIYVAFMLAMVVGLPLLIVYLPNWLLGMAQARLNLPNKDYWLAAERRDATLATLRRTLLWVGYLQVGLMVHAHWLVLRANASQPPRLETGLFLAGLAAFVTTTLVLVLGMVFRFRRIPERGG